MNASKHEHVCHADVYRPHTFDCYKPECKPIREALCGVCVTRVGKAHREGMRKE